MKRFLAVAMATVMLLSLSVAAYALSDQNYPINIEDMDYYQRFQGQDVEINVYNWGEYLANDPVDFIDVNAIFEELTGIKVNYTLFASNEELYAKMKAGGTNYDVIVPSDYMIGRMIKEGMLQKLDYSNIPNYKYIGEQYKNTNFDPNNEYSVPIYWGVVGIIYNKTMVDPSEIKGWDILWDKDYAGNILMFSNSRDAFALSLLDLGYSFNTTDEKELREAADHLIEQKPLVQAYVMDEIYDKMEGGEAAIAPYYNGDAVLMMKENKDLDFYMPKDTSMFVDSFCVPATSENREAAEMYINFMCETDVAAANSIFVGYSTPQTEAYKKLDEDLRDNIVAYPDVTGLQSMLTLPEETNTLIDGLWTETIASNSGNSPWLFVLLIVGLLAAAVTIVLVRRAQKRKKNMY